jgi:glycosyltransferase involved in cell wall biosynthesis
MAYFPLVSVIIPAYNAEAFIQQTLGSVLSQTYKNIEVLVVDDGSQDRTPEIVRLVAQADSRVRLLQQANVGVAIARNRAIQLSKGEYIAPLDADDVWYPEKLEKQVNCFLQASPYVGLVYCWSAHIDEENQLTGGWIAHGLEGQVFFPLVYRNFIGNASAPLMRRTCLEQVGLYNTNLKMQNAQGTEDWDIYLRIAEKYEFRVIPELLVGYRQVNGSMSCDYSKMTRSHNLIMKSIRQNHPDIPEIVYRWSTSDLYFHFAWSIYKSRIAQSAENYKLKNIEKFQSYLYWSLKAARLDITFALRPRFYRVLFLSLANLLISLFTPSLVSKKRLVKQQTNIKTVAHLQEQINHVHASSKDIYLQRLEESSRLPLSKASFEKAYSR